MSRFVMFHSSKKPEHTRLTESVQRGTKKDLACETIIEKYNKCVQANNNISECSKFIFDDDICVTVLKDDKWWGDSWSFTLPGPTIKNKVKVHIPF